VTRGPYPAFGAAASNFRITQAGPNLAIRSLLGVRPGIDKLGFERGHRTLTVLRKGGKIVTIPLAPRTARAIGERLDGPIFLRADGRLPPQQRSRRYDTEDGGVCAPRDGRGTVFLH
jgi:hypothetical protein